MQVAMKFDKRFFFDRKAVSDIVGKQAAKALGKAGAFVRRRARSSLRRRKKTSAAGTPPSVHSQDAVATLKNIQFQFSPQSMSVLVGPLKLNGASGAAVPGIQEHGESSTIFQYRFNEHWFRTSKYNWRSARSKKKPSNPWRTRSKQSIARLRAGNANIETRQVVANYAQRPYMGPALTAELPKFPSLFGRSA